ncbi:MAG: zf-HC2 domain-containing protein [Methylococcus sp.]|nr:zf-HC2 domain-containing protein [Methylococcus sp.]
MLSCKDVSRLLSLSMDQSLPLRKRIEIRIHIWFCKACPNLEKQLLFLRQAARRLDEEALQSDQVKLSAEARERIRKAVRP